MPVSIVPTQSNIQTALNAFLTAILDPSVDVIEGQDNRVPEPSNSDFVVMTPILRNRLATNVEAAVDAVPPSYTLLQSTMVTVQLDVHGPNSSDNAQLISTLLRSHLGVWLFKQSGFDVSPLYAGDPRQSPFVNAEDQYEYRYTVDAVLQANQVVTTQITALGPQFATAITIAPTPGDL